MKDFEDLQHVWQEQFSSEKQTTATDLLKKAKGYTKTIKRKHFWTIAILLMTFILLIIYFIWANFYVLSLFTIGLGVMMGMLLLRIVLEIVSIRRFEKLRLDLSLQVYTQLVTKFYNWRKKLHYIVTPVIYIGYFCGFMMILPILKVNLSSGFFNYILFSGLIVFIGLAVFIYQQIRKELILMKYLKLLNAE